MCKNLVATHSYSYWRAITLEIFKTVHGFSRYFEKGDKTAFPRDSGSRVWKGGVHFVEKVEDQKREAGWVKKATISL